jgi:peroxiredoxin
MDTISPAPSTCQSTKSRERRKAIATIAFVAMLAGPALLLIALQRSNPSRSLRPGDLIPVAKLSENNQGRSLLAGIEGKIAAISFFSIDCPHCQREIPLFNEAWRRFGDQVEFFAVAFSDELKVGGFSRAHDIRLPVIVDPQAVTGKAFGVSELPTLFLINQDRTIEWIGTGERSKGEIFRRLSALIEKNRSIQVSVRNLQERQ